MPRAKQQDAPSPAPKVDTVGRLQQGNGAGRGQARPGAVRKEGGTAKAGGARVAAARTAGAKATSPKSAGLKVEKAKTARAKDAAVTKDGRQATGRQTEAVASRADEEGRARELFLEHQRQLLLAERCTYTRQAEELKAQAEALALEHEPGDVQFDEEGGEGGTVNVDREMDLHLSAQAQAAIEEIDTALTKIAEGNYGLCENCGNPIPKARLEALPHARLCVSCKSGGLSARRQ